MVFMQETRTTAAHERQEGEIGEKLWNDGARGGRLGPWSLIQQDVFSCILHGPQLNTSLGVDRGPNQDRVRSITGNFKINQFICFMSNYVAMHTNTDPSKHPAR